ncbi:MAG TPA: OPT/YSL family transporter, partial [Usitatibacter sp.]|nr:OPT/YSL family transporter [Usitatibacter sp.]
MALLQLDEKEIREWSRERKDRWWLENVYRGDMPQLTLRSAVTGFLLGGVLAATALYIAGKTGITIGVGLTSVILAFAIYRGLAAAGIGRDFTILENNCTQSIATAAGYMVAPMISSLAAYMMVTGRIIPWWHMVLWMTVVAILGVLVAFPMKRRFINEEQLPFPEGRASGVVLDALYTGAAAAGMFKARLLLYTALVAGSYQLVTSDGWMKLLQFKVLRMDRWAGMKEPWTFHDRLDSYYYAATSYVPRILGTDIRQLGLRLTLDAAMLGVGGLMGIAVATSCLLGAFVNFVILAPLMIQAGDIAPRLSPTGTLVPISRAEIVNQWSLWWGVTMMVVGSLTSLLARPQVIVSAFRNLRGNREAGSDVLGHIEFPLWISAVGVPVFSVLGAWVTHSLFGVPWLLAFISLPLIFVLTIICANSMALTSWTPTGALAKITQFSIGAIDRANPA